MHPGLDMLCRHVVEQAVEPHEGRPGRQQGTGPRASPVMGLAQGPVEHVGTGPQCMPVDLLLCPLPPGPWHASLMSDPGPWHRDAISRASRQNTPAPGESHGHGIE